MNDEPRDDAPGVPERAAATPAIEPRSPSAPAEPLVDRAPVRPADARPGAGRPSKPELVLQREPVYWTASGYRLRLDPPDLARLRELPGSKGKTDAELGEQFLQTHAERLIAAFAGDVPEPAEIRVVVDPYSRQAFLALQNTIRGIVSF